MRSEPDCCGKAVPTLFRKERIVFGFDDSVAMTGDCCEAHSIQNQKVSTRITDQVLLLKYAGSLVYTLASHAQHVGQEFLRKSKVIGAHPVAGHQQPPGKPGVDWMKSVTRGTLSNLRQG